jgi:hypothetical protein
MIYTDLKYQGKTSLDYQYTFNFKKWRAGGKNKSFLGVGTSGNGDGHKERGNKGECGGWVLCPYMKIEVWGWSREADCFKEA